MMWESQANYSNNVQECVKVLYFSPVYGGFPPCPGGFRPAVYGEVLTTKLFQKRVECGSPSCIPAPFTGLSACSGFGARRLRRV